jgi:cardiolipin synthase A/B
MPAAPERRARRAPGRRALWLTSLLLLGLTACARVQPHVQLPDVQIGEPSFFPTLEAYASAPITARNAVDVLLNGEQIFPAMVEAIRSARTSITYAQYFLDDGQVTRELVDALVDRCRAGVGVSILLDAFGALDMPADYIDRMKSAGCRVVMFRPLSPFRWHHSNQRNHRRILVVDGRVGFTGGSGLSRKWMGNGRMENHWRDTDVRVRGPIVEYLQGAFAENWLEATGIVLGGSDYFPRPVTPAGEAYAQVVRSSPAGGSFAMYTMFLLAISAARRTIFITNPYFVPDATMEDALLAAVQRGVRVVVLVPGAIDHNLVRQASRGKFGKMLKAGVEIHEYRAALLHAKTMIVDGVWSTVGSTNLDNRSFALNDELNLVVYDAVIARRLEKVFADDLAHSVKVDYRSWSRRGVVSRFLELIASPARPLL